MKTWTVVNPVAGRGRAARVWARLQDQLKNQGMIFETHYTQGPGHAMEIGRKAVEQEVQQLVVVGGDGTLHELVNGVGPTGKRLGVIPAGTGNDLARTLKIPHRPEAALGLLFHGREREIDLGLVNGHYFTNIAGVGFDAAVAHHVNTGRHLINGTVTYLLAVLMQLWKFRCLPAEITLDGEKLSRRIFLLAAGNAKYYGGGMMMVPSAEPDDGTLDVVLGWDFTRLEILRALMLIFSGRHLGLPKLLQRRVREIYVTSSQPLALHADGEVIGTTPAHFRIVPRALKVLVP
ncbi:MAG: diacylglycerol kinase family lipid kinase [Firmicutes bacterium]|nr:diacylglycerol kinase family lipid kinase [Bacillota bacterium]